MDNPVIIVSGVLAGIFIVMFLLKARIYSSKMDAAEKIISYSKQIAGLKSEKLQFHSSCEMAVGSDENNKTTYFFMLDKNDGAVKTTVIEGIIASKILWSKTAVPQIKGGSHGGFTATPVQEAPVYLVDETFKKLCIFDCHSISFAFVNPSDIIGVDLIKHEKDVTETVIRTDRDSQAADVVVGEVVVPGTIKRANGNQNTWYELIITVSDSEKPAYRCSFAVINAAKNWHDIFCAMIVQTQQELKDAPTLQNASSISVADELVKLVKLRDSGAISEEEYNVLKNKIVVS